MTKFRCIKGTDDFPIGTIIEGELQGKTIVLTKDSTVKNVDNNPYFQKGEPVPLTGYAWQWESCEGEPDKEELLSRFEIVVDILISCERDFLLYGKSDTDHGKAMEKYESARAELLKRLS